MKLNKKYSYNGYDPLSDEVKTKKLDLRKRMYDVEVARLNLFEELEKLKYYLGIEKISNHTYETKKKWFANELKKLQIRQYTLRKEITTIKEGFKYKSFLSTPVIEFNHTEVVGSNFSQREPYTNVFNPQLTGAQFTNCVLINCNIPMNNTIVGGVNLHIKIQNDGELWLVDKQLNPVDPLHEEKFIQLSLSTDPKDIPSKPVNEPITLTAEKEAEKLTRKNKMIDIINDPAKLQEILDKGELI